MTTTTRRTFRDLERLALQSHTAGASWASLWAIIAADVRALEPIHRGRFRKLVERLLHLWASGDESGAEPPNSDPWELADAPAVAVDDVRTAARCRLPLAPLPVTNKSRPAEY
jgi:hypothetical protein